MSIDEVTSTDVADVTELNTPLGSGVEPRAVRLGLRDRIPAEGLREYWYPAILDAKVPRRRPVRRTVLGEELVFFRGKTGGVVALTNWCPHRNASLAQGKCMFPGTIVCPYHGIVFDETGEALAFLGEGPTSSWCGQQGTSARAFPTNTLKGVVFVWMGDGEPAPIEEDVPPEFFDPKAMVLAQEQVWKANWRVALENLQDGHVFFVHRNSIEVLSQDDAGLNLLFHMGPRRPPTRIVNDRALVFDDEERLFAYVDTPRGREVSRQKPAVQDIYPQLGNAKFPRTLLRFRFAKVMRTVRKLYFGDLEWLCTDPEWAQGVHLPTIFRTDLKSHIYTRTVTPIDANRSRSFYYTTYYPSSRAQALQKRVSWHLYYNWKQHRNFSGQDRRIVEQVKYDNPREKFSTSDAFPLAWRRMVISHARSPKGTKTQAGDGPSAER